MPKGSPGQPRLNRRSATPTHNALHLWLRRTYPKKGECERCGKTGRTHYAALSHDNYTRNREDYLELCGRCHLKHDGRRPPSRKGARISPAHVAALQSGRRRRRLETA